MTRKQLRFLIALACAIPPNAFALGVGQIQVRSALNQALDADIPLLLAGSAEAAGVTAKLAPTALFAQRGIDRLPMLSNLVFTVQTGADGRGLIKVTSRQPIREPVLNFLLQVDWPKGQVVREFVVLLDPPARTRQRPAVSAPTVAALAPPATPSPGSPRQPVGMAPPEPTSSPPAVAHRGTATYGPVPPGQTLWNIASRVRPDPAVSIHRMMEALLAANPRAFWKPNVDGLRAGATLRVPSAQEIDPQRFSEQVSRQLASRQQIPVASVTPQPTAPAAESTSKVKLVPPELAEKPPQSSQPIAAPRESAATALASTPSFPIKLKDNHPALHLAGLEDLRQRMATAGTGENGGASLTSLPTAPQPAESRPPQPEQQPSPAGGVTPPPAPRLQEALPETMTSAGIGKGAPAEPIAVAPPPAVMLPPQTPPPPSATVVAPIPPPVTTPPSPLPVKSLPPPTPGETGDILGGWLDPSSLALLAGLGLLLGGSWYWWRRRAQSEEGSKEGLIFEDMIPLEPVTATEPMKGPVLATTLEKEPAKEPRIARMVPNPVERADLLLAVGNYAEAENLLRRSLREEPDNQAVLAKLLDVHFANRDTTAFLQGAQRLYETLQDKADPLWSHVMQMGQKLCPDHELFSQPDELLISTKTITANLAEFEALDKASGAQQATPAFEPAETTLFDTLQEPTLIADEQNINLAEFDWQLSDLDKPTQTTESLPEEPTRPLGSRDTDRTDTDKLTLTTIPLLEEPTRPEDRSDKVRIDDSEQTPLTTIPFFEEPTRPPGGHDTAWISADEATPTAIPFPDQPTRPATQPDKMQAKGELQWRLLDLEQSPLQPPLPGRPEEKEKSSATPLSELDFTLDSLFIRKSDASRLSPATAKEEPARKTELPVLPQQSGLSIEGIEIPALSGDDYAETKLDLAEAYLEMGDPVGARGLLEEVLQQGNEQQQQRARAFMEKVNQL